MNPNNELPISNLHDINGSPLFPVFDKIVLSMKSKINTLSSITVFLNYCLLNHFNINEVDVVFSNNIPSPDIIHDWIDIKNFKSILLINLVYDTKIQLPFTEYCCALLFSNTVRALKYSRLCLFRPFKTELTDLSDDLNYLIEAEQIEKKHVRQLWTTFLPAAALNILKDTFFDTNSQIVIDPNKLYQLDLNLGKLSENHIWLAIALAAEGVNQGQKGQIVAAQGNNEIHVIQLYDKNIQTEEDDDDKLFFYPIAFVFSIIFCMFSAIALLPANSIEYLNLSLTVTVGAILFTIVNTLCLYFKLLSYRDNFDEQWAKALNKINEKRDN